MRNAVKNQLRSFLGSKKAEHLDTIVKSFETLRTQGFGLCIGENRRHRIQTAHADAMTAIETWLSGPLIPPKFKSYFEKQWTKQLLPGMLLCVTAC